MPRSLSVIDYPISKVELELLRQLSLDGARFMLVGMMSAILQGADGITRDIDLWFGTTSDGRLSRAARSVGGTFILRADPPCLGGRELRRIDLVNHMSGLGDFEEEYSRAIDCQIDDFVVKLLPVERILESKQAAARPKDIAVIPSLMALIKSKEYL
jgi:predicted nucleotidyltransferase